METPSKVYFQSDQNFFGFKPEDRITFHENLFNLIWYGEGRWDWDTVYNMPIHIRRYWIKRVNDIIQARTPTPDSKPNKPNKKPRT